MSYITSFFPYFLLLHRLAKSISLQVKFSLGKRMKKSWHFLIFQFKVRQVQKAISHTISKLTIEFFCMEEDYPQSLVEFEHRFAMDKEQNGIGWMRLAKMYDASAKCLLLSLPEAYHVEVILSPMTRAVASHMEDTGYSREVWASKDRQFPHLIAALLKRWPLVTY